MFGFFVFKTLYEKKKDSAFLPLMLSYENWTVKRASPQTGMGNSKIERTWILDDIVGPHIFTSSKNGLI